MDGIRDLIHDLAPVSFHFSQVDHDTSIVLVELATDFGGGWLIHVPGEEPVAATDRLSAQRWVYRLLDRCEKGGGSRPDVYEQPLATDGEMGQMLTKITNSGPFYEFEPDQEYSSAATSRSTVSSVVGMVERTTGWKKGTVNVDIGGGRFQKMTATLQKKGVTNLVYDPYNRSAEHNASVYARVQETPADTVTISNVLNVIKEASERQKVLRLADRMLKTGGYLYINVYKGDGSGAPRKTRDGWQENRSIDSYLAEVRTVFPNAVRHGALIHATKGQKTAIIRKCKPGDSEDGKPWCLYDRNEDKLLGRHPSREHALKQERVIEMKKHSARDKNTWISLKEARFFFDAQTTQYDMPVPASASTAFWEDAFLHAAYGLYNAPAQGMQLQNRLLRVYPQDWVAWLFNIAGWWDEQTGRFVKWNGDQQPATPQNQPATPQNQQDTRILYRQDYQQAA